MDHEGAFGDTEEQSERMPRPNSLSQEVLEDSAENLVRAEAQAVRFLRGSVILLLIVAATITGIFVHRLSAKNKIDAFTSDFEDVANQFVRTFRYGVANQLYYSYTLSYAMGTGLDSGSKPNFPYVAIENIDSQALALNLQTTGQDIIWSPLLTTHRERQSWELYAKNTQQSGAGANAPLYPPCNVCGEGFEVANPAELVSFPGVQGSFQCSDVAQDGLEGLIGTENCLAIQPLIHQNCGCRMSDGTKTHQTEQINNGWTISDGIFRLENGTAVRDDGPTPFSPVWQISPSVSGKLAIMFNQMSVPVRRNAIKSMIKNKVPVLSKTIDPTVDCFYRYLRAEAMELGVQAVLFFPVFDVASSEVVGSLAVDFSWKLLFENDLTPRSEGVVIVLENTCDQTYSFKVSGGEVAFLGDGDLHDSDFNELAVQSTYEDFLQLIESVAPNRQGESSEWGCTYRIRVYPSNDMRSRYLTNEPWIATLVVISIFVFTSSVFLMYDFIVRRLQAKVLSKAKRSEAIVSSLFPAVVRDRLYRDGQSGHTDFQDTSRFPSLGTSRQSHSSSAHGMLNPKALLKSYLSHPPSVDVSLESEPIADLFPNTTILFADIAGFTAWSSEREPSQVFKLLETLYGAFDQVANRLGVFKVETIGDCYVAASGMPEPRDDHAVVMVEFASECLRQMHELTSRLESTLGPGTADLTIRVGLHSGPVTAGVLRAERARFQLFGDTMNTASRIESHGKINQIHVSHETAQLLIEAGKSDWVEQRAELITVKGKGEMQTYWIKPNTSSATAQNGALSTADKDAGIWGGTNIETELPWKTTPSNNQEQLIEWNAALLHRKLQKLAAKRNALAKCRARSRQRSSLIAIGCQETLGVHIVDQITEVIKMPDFNERIVKDEVDPFLIDLGPAVRSQLREYVATVASLYSDNPFHNFEHASHVAMSARKLLKRVIAPDDVEYRTEAGKKLKSRKILFKEIHDTTFGISSDPLMQFAIIFSALIHDVDHCGLQNWQLVQRKDPLAITYRGKCIAEQHSTRTAWEILMEDRFKDLRWCIYQTEDERMRFRQLVINGVIATDIGDQQLQTWRTSRWSKAFQENVEARLSSEDKTTLDLKATIVYEYIIQASDVAHTMQHWHVYKKWNQRLFDERYSAYLQGKDGEDPSVNWYQGELDFFDNYVIPLARSLEECNVFGVSCDELLTYALANRNEWELKGKQIVQEMVDLLEPFVA